jgi:hypothetical protein
MKPGNKKTKRDETHAESPDSENIIGNDNRNNPDGIDAIRALQMIAAGIAILALVWFVLHNFLHII